MTRLGCVVPTSACSPSAASSCSRCAPAWRWPRRSSCSSCSDGSGAWPRRPSRGSRSPRHAASSRRSPRRWRRPAPTCTGRWASRRPTSRCWPCCSWSPSPTGRTASGCSRPRSPPPRSSAMSATSSSCGASSGSPWPRCGRRTRPALFASAGVALAIAAVRHALASTTPTLVTFAAEVAAGAVALLLCIRFCPLPAIRRELRMRLTGGRCARRRRQPALAPGTARPRPAGAPTMIELLLLGLVLVVVAALGVAVIEVLVRGPRSALRCSSAPR